MHFSVGYQTRGQFDLKCRQKPFNIIKETLSKLHLLRKHTKRQTKIKNNYAAHIPARHRSRSQFCCWVFDFSYEDLPMMCVDCCDRRRTLDRQAQSCVRGGIIKSYDYSVHTNRAVFVNIRNKQNHIKSCFCAFKTTTRDISERKKNASVSSIHF